MKEGPRESRIIRCPSCQRYYRLAGAALPKPGARLRCTKCGEVFALPGGAERAPAPPAAARGRGRVLVATDAEEVAALIGGTLRAAGFELRGARTGEEAWDLIGSWEPPVALLDVALPGTPCFEICDRLRAPGRAAAPGVILIASVFQHTRYKRAPVSLYGADDYVEKHHIPDLLPGKVARLLGAGAAAGQAHRDARLGEPEKRSLIREELSLPGGGARQGAERLRESLRRYARIIVSDIALYNQELVERGVREGSFYQVLKKELEEGRRLYLSRAPASAGAADLFAEAVDEFLDGRSGRRGGAGHGKGGRA